jgi:hypothetical protein
MAFFFHFVGFQLNFQSTFILLIPIEIMKCFTDSEMRNNYSKYLYDTEQSFVPGIDETKPEKVYETKRNFTLDETKRNEISLFFLFRETSEISRNKFFVSHSFVFRETEKRKRNGNPIDVAGT